MAASKEDLARGLHSITLGTEDDDAGPWCGFHEIMHRGALGLE